VNVNAAAQDGSFFDEEDTLVEGDTMMTAIVGANVVTR